jgi:cell division protein FtsX
VVDGGDWVVEFRELNGAISVYPLVGWRIDGTAATPISARPLSDSATVLPRTAEHDRLIRTTAASLRPQPEVQPQQTWMNNFR